MNGLVSFGLCTLTDEELIEKVDSLTDEMYKTGQLHSRHIPARPNADYDLLVGELLMRFKNKSGIHFVVEKFKTALTVFEISFP